MSNPQLLSATSQLNSDDILFIKRFHRFPLRSFKRVFPFIFFFIVAITFLLMMVWLYDFSLWSTNGKKMATQIFIFSIILISLSVRMYRYWRSLFFNRLPAAIDAVENAVILRSFLHAHSFRFYQPDKHPEVYMMSSREDQQAHESEIVIFIAVDKSILVNSHISTVNIFPKQRRQYQQVVSLLIDFIQTQQREPFGVVHPTIF